MQEKPNKELNLALMRLAKRAETNTLATLLATFVDVGELLATRLSTRDHQVVYGRRGTGKTHALKYLGDSVRKSGDHSIYLDLRLLGSTNSIYADSTLPLGQRATRLLADVLITISDDLLDFVAQRPEGYDAEKAFALLNEFQAEVVKLQTKESERRSKLVEQVVEDADKLGVKASLSGAEVQFQSEAANRRLQREETNDSGEPHYRVHFGEVGSILRRLIDVLPFSRLWFLLDEWSALPRELQPTLADFLRRALFPLNEVVVKIGAIQFRSRFRIPLSGGDYIGIELGADATADVDLDDFMVFDNSADTSQDFFAELVFRHVSEVLKETGSKIALKSPADFVQMAFTQVNAFSEFVRAAEGVPRDAMNVISHAAQAAKDNPISIEHVRAAARQWYQRDKESSATEDKGARDLLHWIVDDVIQKRKARAFLLSEDQAEDPLIFRLFDARVLHVLKRSVSSHDTPGYRYRVYKLDYGCYVDLIKTQRSPLGLFQTDEADDGSWVQVPADDYRSIRRAILDLKEFHAR